MKVTYNWLKEYVDFSLTPQELAAQLTEAGFEVEEWRPLIPQFSGVVVGKVEKVDRHPQADKLSVCEVSTGLEKFQVICGAPNVTAGQIVPFAQIGAMLPIGLKIKKAKIRGVESFGMICSRQELGLEKASDGIWPFEQSFPLGKDVFELLAAEQDYIFDLNVTPNRPDCLSMFGIAREISAITGQPLRFPDIGLKEDAGKPVESYIRIEIEDTAGCPRYAGRIIHGVRIDDSPVWLQKRLEAVGLRPINNIVDITNFVLMELGHPLHAFDLSQISDNKIQVRASKAGEKFTTLDSKERLLPENTVMICDTQRPVAIGGIMGGMNSEVTTSTADILLESAYFNPQRIAVSAKKLGLSSEASQRFERGADPNGVIRAINRAAVLMAEIAGGTIAQGIIDVYPHPIEPVVITFRAERINKLLGSNLDEALIRSTLQKLDLDVNDVHVIVPTFRVDLKREVDLIEEVARLINYSNLPTRITTEIDYEIQESPQENLISFLRERLIELGLQETVTSGMLAKSEAELFQQDSLIGILNPISDDMTTMRPSLLPGLLKAVAYNLNRNIKDIRFFEIGRVFVNYRQDKLPEQPYSMAIALTGNRHPVTWNNAAVPIDFYDIKGILEVFLDKIFLDNCKIILYDTAEYMTSDETVAIAIDGETIGLCGKISAEVSAKFGIDASVYVVELNADKFAAKLNLQREYKPIAKFPYTDRDMALIFDEAIPVAEIIGFVKGVGGELLNFIEVFDVFRGGVIPAGKKSLAMRLRFQSIERTLSDEEVDKIFRQIIIQTEKRFQASLRK